MKYKYSLVMTTLPKKKEAEKISKEIISNKLAACIQIEKIKSFYKWNGKVQNENEYLLLIKTRSRRFKKLKNFVKKHHSYEIPEIIQIPIKNGSKEYLSWIKAGIKGTSNNR